MGTEFLKKWRAERTKDINLDEIVGNGEKKEKPDVDRILASWKQGTKEEDPRFQTTWDNYGFKAPTAATFVSERAGRPQDFSKSFQGMKPQNSGLNCGLTKSNVHPSLDPQFAQAKFKQFSFV